MRNDIKRPSSKSHPFHHSYASIVYERTAKRAVVRYF